MVALRCVIAVTTLVFASAIAAQSDDFENVRDLWLSGNDRDSLPALAALAEGGDANARVLLGRIESGDKGLSPYRARLTRSESIDLFRKTGDGPIFGKSWLRVEAEAGNVLAETLIEARLLMANPDVIRKLHELGELQSSEDQIRFLIRYGPKDELRRLDKDRFILSEFGPLIKYGRNADKPHSYGMAALEMMVGRNVPYPLDGSDEAGMARMLAYGFRFGDTNKENRWRGEVDQWLSESDVALPLRNLCERGCEAADIADCTFAALAITGGYYELIGQDTPVESLISQAEFLDSPRAEIMALRRIALAYSGTDLSWLADYDEIADMSVCLADAVRAERAKYLDIR